MLKDGEAAHGGAAPEIGEVCGGRRCVGRARDAHNFTTAAPASTETKASDAMDMHRRTRYSILGGPRATAHLSLSGAPSASARAARSARRRCCSPRFSTRPNSNRQPCRRTAAPQPPAARGAAGRPRAVGRRAGDPPRLLGDLRDAGANATPTWRCRPVGEQRAAAAGVRVVSGERRLLPTTEDGAACAPGQLTPTGFAHVALGAPPAARRAAPRRPRAQPLAQRRRLPSAARLRAIDRLHTDAMSAAALLSSLLPPSPRAQAAPAVMATYEDEAREMMHGAGLASSSKIAGQDGGGETRRGVRACRRARDRTD